jgi:hypothetical protein
MATMIFTAQKNHGPVDSWFKNAAGGKGVRIKYGKKIYALFEANRIPKNYAETTYGVTRKELKAFAERMDVKIEKDRKAGRSKKFTGDIETLLHR